MTDFPCSVAASPLRGGLPARVYAEELAGLQAGCLPPASEDRLLLLRGSYLTRCAGDHCAALLLEWFLHQPRPPASAPPALAVSALALEAALFGLYARQRITTALHHLQGLGLLTISRNPDPRYRFDACRHFTVHPDALCPVPPPGGAL